MEHLIKCKSIMQLGVVSVGQPFPFWAGRQTPLFLRVATAEPAPLVRLTRGLELAVAPRPRKRPQKDAIGPEAGREEEGALPHPNQVAWLRLQVRPCCSSSAGSSVQPDAQ